MDRKRQDLLCKRKQLMERGRQLQLLLEIIEKERHKIEVERMHWQSLNQSETASCSNEKSSASTPRTEFLCEAEVNLQEANFEVLELMSTTEKEEEEEEKEEEQPDAVQIQKMK